MHILLLFEDSSGVKGYVNSNWTRVGRSMLENGGTVVLTSGINGTNTRTQRERSIKDSVDLFTSDTLKGRAKKPELAKVLCEDSGTDVEWLMDKFNLDLSLVARFGGHSVPRTHRGKERFPGMTVTCAPIDSLPVVLEKPKDRIFASLFVSITAPDLQD